MNVYFERILQFLLVLVLLFGTISGVGELTVAAQTDPLPRPICEGLACAEQQDCGTACFCNRPSTTCFGNSEFD